MKFIYRIIIGLSALMLVFVSVWGIFFFRSMEEEINDETDDMLEEYSADIIMRWLSGVEIPSTDNGSNNTYYIRKVTPEYAMSVPQISYEDEMIFIASKDETEAARIRHQVFMDSEGAYFELVVAVPTFERADLKNAILKWMLMLYVVLLVGSVAITAIVVNYNFRPLKALLRWIENYVPGKPGPPVPCDTGITEFRTIARATQDAADRFERQYELQNQFIGNASHELQTPLAICTGRIEMLLDSEGLTEEQAEGLMDVSRTLSGMVRLNRTLLLMTKIDNGQFIDTSGVDICRLARDTAASFSEIYEAEGITASVHESGPLVVDMNEQLSTVLVSNLVKNAFVHSGTGADVQIEVGQGVFSVSNPGESALDSERIFDRFWHGSGKKEGSTGLGLSLVKAICDRYSFGLEYSFNGRHVFTVRMPVDGNRR